MMNGIIQKAQALGPVSKYIAVTSNLPITALDTGTFLDITSGTFTQTFETGGLTSNWSVFVHNSGSGDITIPNSDGVSNWIIYPGELRLFTWNGVNPVSKWIVPFSKQITTLTSLKKPPGYLYIGARMWSGSASGERTNDVTQLSRGGAGGGCGDFIIPTSSMAASETITIGSGGAAVTTIAVGNIGGDTTFGSLATVFAGNSWNTGGNIIGSGASSTSAVGFEGAAGSAGAGGRAIWGGSSGPTNGVGAGGRTVYGGASGGSLSAAAVVGAPGTSVFAGAGGAAVSASSASAGVEPGGGGGATQTGTASGAGAKGRAIVYGVS